MGIAANTSHLQTRAPMQAQQYPVHISMELAQELLRIASSQLDAFAILDETAALKRMSERVEALNSRILAAEQA